MKNSIKNNLEMWDKKYDWTKDGDEWDGQAHYCDQPYPDWKKSVIEVFIAPNCGKETDVLEIAPGHGRWSKEIIGRCKSLTLVDLSSNCIEYCKSLLASHGNVRYVVNDGKSLKGVDDESVDFVWSYDSFVHMDEETINAYIRDIHRVLKRNGIAIIHHAARKNSLLWLGFLINMGKSGRNLYKAISMVNTDGSDGWRSNVSRELVASIARKNGLEIERQVQKWGANNEYGVARFGDYITILRK